MHVGILMALELVLTQLWPLELRCFRQFFLHCTVYQFLLQFSMNVFYILLLSMVGFNGARDNFDKITVS